MVVLDGDADLLEVVGTLSPPGCLPGRLDRRQQQRDQDPNDGDDHEQFDQRETLAVRVVHGNFLRG